MLECKICEYKIYRYRVHEVSVHRNRYSKNHQQGICSLSGRYDDFKKLFSKRKIVKNVLVQFSRACQDESIALKNFQKFEFYYNSIGNITTSHYMSWTNPDQPLYDDISIARNSTKLESARIPLTD